MTASIGFDRQVRKPTLRMSSRWRKRNRALKQSRRRRRRLLRCGGGKQSRAPASSKEVAERLAALRSLIPPRTGAAAAAAAADRLFEEAAEYILHLRTQVEVLKRLVGVHSPSLDKNAGCA